MGRKEGKMSKSSSPTRAAIYARVSTTDQTTKNQTRQLKSYCENRGWKVVKIFEDRGVSGSQASRPGLDALMEQVRQGRYQAVVVWKFDRFARSTQHLLQALTEFQALGVDFVSCSEGVDTSTPAGRMVFTFLGAVAEFERSLIRERVKAGIERAQEAGVHCGRPRAAFDVGRAIKMKQEGLGVRRIAKQLGVSKSTIDRALRDVSKASLSQSA